MALTCVIFMGSIAGCGCSSDMGDSGGASGSSSGNSSTGGTNFEEEFVVTYSSEEHIKALAQYATVLDYHTSSYGGEYYIEAEVECPDYKKYFEETWKEADENTKTEEEFNDALFEAVIDLANKEEDLVVRSVKINVSDMDFEKSENYEWEEEEMLLMAKEAAVQQDLENFCMDLLLGISPSLEAEDE